MHILRRTFHVYAVLYSHNIYTPRELSLIHSIFACESTASRGAGVYRSHIEWAVISNRVYLIKFLIECGANVNSSYGMCLQCAIWNNNSVLVDILIQAGADVNLHHDYYSPSITYAIECSSAGILTQLLDAGAVLPPDALAHALASGIDSSNKVSIINKINNQ